MVTSGEILGPVSENAVRTQPPRIPLVNDRLKRIGFKIQASASPSSASPHRGVVAAATLGAAAVLGTVVAAATTVSLARPGLAQDGCFMVNPSGQTISLGALCGYGSEPAAASSSSRTGRASHRADNSVQVPIQRRLGRTPVIRVTFNGNRSYDMILDTGASGTLITSAMARELGVKPNGVFRAQIADGSSVQFAMGRLKSISVENAKVQNVDVAIAPDMEIGLLGHDFFGDFDISIKENAVEFTRR